MSNPFTQDKIGEPDWSSDQHVLYNWTVFAIFPILNPKGMVVTPDPSPLTESQIEDVFRRIEQSAEWTGQTVITHTVLTGEGNPPVRVSLNTDGTITTEKL